MTSSEQIREWYHEGVVLNHADRGTPGYEPRCNHNHPTVAFPRSGGVFNEPVHPLCHEAFEAYATTMRAMSINMSGAGGVNHCRNIGDTDDPSLHAYLCAVDLPPNSYKPTSFLVAIEDIRTNSGAQVFRTLDGDRMHDQIDCSPTALATGINLSTVAGYIGDDDMTPEQQAALDWLVDARASRFGDDPPWGNAKWDGYLTEWTAPPGPGNPVTHIQLAHIYHELRANSQLGPKGDKGDPGPKGATGATGADGKPVSLTISGDVVLP